MVLINTDEFDIRDLEKKPKPTTGWLDARVVK